MLIHAWKCEIGLVDVGELNFDQSFLKFKVKGKNIWKSSLKEHSQFDWKSWILDTASLSSEFIATIMLNFFFTLPFSSKRG